MLNDCHLSLRKTGRLGRRACGGDEATVCMSEAGRVIYSGSRGLTPSMLQKCNCGVCLMGTSDVWRRVRWCEVGGKFYVETKKQLEGSGGVVRRRKRNFPGRARIDWPVHRRLPSWLSTFEVETSPQHRTSLELLLVLIIHHTTTPSPLHPPSRRRIINPLHIQRHRTSDTARIPFPHCPRHLPRKFIWL